MLLVVAIYALCFAVVLMHSAGRDLSEQPIGVGGWLLLTVLLGPVSVALYFLVTRSARRVPRTGHKRCPDCCEDVRADAAVCRFCRHEFPAPGTPDVG